METKSLLIALAVAAFQLAGILTAVRAVMDVRTAQGTIAWVVSLITLPYLAVPAFWVFGRSRFHGYVKLRRQGFAQTNPTARQFAANLVARNLIAFPGPNRESILVEKLARMPFTQGNEAELLINGDATFASIFAGLERARDYILIQFYIIRDDGLGRKLKQQLLAKAGAGVRCYVLYDEVGTRLPRAFVDELRAGGVQVKPFNTTRGRANRFQLNFRNHRKIVVVDGREAWVGGLNVGDEYLGRDSKVGFWRDTHLRLAGPVVLCVQVAFLEDWQWASGELAPLNWDVTAAPGGHNRAILCLPSGPADTLESCTLFFINAINVAQQRLWIASPYFVPDEQFVTALQLAALRGVDVRILVPEKADNVLVNLSGWSYVPELEKSGIKIYRHQKGFMHQKVTLIDDYCTVGTANFDNRSFRLNFEITMAFADRDFAGQIATMLERDFADATLVTARHFQEHGFWFRFATRIARLMSPLQ